MTRATSAIRTALPLGTSGNFRFAVVADTHSKPHAASASRLAELEPDAILHAGDIGALEVLDELGKLAPVFAVRGNIDGPSDVPERRLIELTRGDTVQLRLLLVHIAVYGPKLRAEVARLAASERASLVVCGHSHVPFIGRDRGITVFNPGSIGPRRFQLPIVFGAIDIRDGTARLRHIDCETGKTWTPPQLTSATR